MTISVFGETADVVYEQDWAALMSALLGNGAGISGAGVGVVLEDWNVAAATGLNVNVAAGSGFVGPYLVTTDAAESVAVPAGSTRFICAKATIGAGLLSSVTFTAESSWPTDSATAKYVPLARVVAGASTITSVLDVRRLKLLQVPVAPVPYWDTSSITSTDFFAAAIDGAMGFMYTGAGNNRYFGYSWPKVPVAAADNPYKWLFVTVTVQYLSGTLSLRPYVGDVGKTIRTLGTGKKVWRINVANTGVVDHPALQFLVDGALDARFNVTAHLTNDYGYLTPDYDE